MLAAGRKNNVNAFLIDQKETAFMLSVLEIDRLPSMLKEIGFSSSHKLAILINHDSLKSNLFKFHAQMIEAQFAYDRGMPVDGLESLRKALALGKEQKYLNIFADHPAVTAKLCAKIGRAYELRGLRQAFIHLI